MARGGSLRRADRCSIRWRNFLEFPAKKRVPGLARSAGRIAITGSSSAPRATVMTWTSVFEMATGYNSLLVIGLAAGLLLSSALALGGRWDSPLAVYLGVATVTQLPLLWYFSKCSRACHR